MRLKTSTLRFIDAIPLIDVTGLEVNAGSFRVTARNAHYTIYVNDVINHASFLFTLRLSVVDHQHLPFDLRIADEVSTQFHTRIILCPINTQLAHRFYASLLKIPVKSLPSAPILHSIAEMMHTEGTTFAVTSALASSILGEAIIDALVFGNEMTRIEFGEAEFLTYFSYVK
jgi:hypothetical protein